MNQTVVNEMFKTISIKEGLLPLKVAPFYHRKIKEVEALGNHLGPLHRVSFPTQDRLLLRAPNEVKDFVDDRSNAFGSTHKTSIVRKYADRILFLTTSECFGNCQYCFRTDVLTEAGAPDKQTGLADLHLLRDYLGANPEVTEVILSGDDPLILPASGLAEIIEWVRSVPSVMSIQVHTRAIVYEPKAFTADKIDVFAKHNVRIVFHIVDPYEIAKMFLNKSKSAATTRSGSTTSSRCYVTRMTTIWSSTSSWRCSTRWAYAISRSSFQIPSTSPRHSACV